MATKIVVTGTRGIPDVPGGIESHVENLFPHIARSGFEVTICCRSCYIPEEKRIPEYGGCKLHYIDTPRKKGLEAVIHTFKSVIFAKRIKADILHVHAVGPALLSPLARMLGLKVVFTHHGPDYERKKWGRVARFMLRSGERFGCSHASGIIAISESIRSLIERKYGRTDIVVIPNGVNMPKPVDGMDYLESLGIAGIPYVFSAARFVEEKGLHDLLDAFSGLGKNGWKLVIAGDADHETEYSRKLKEKAAKQPNIILTGFIKGLKLAQVFSHARLFVLPSYHEGLPIALLEAMSYNLPILVSDIPPHNEMNLAPECYFSTGDIRDLAESLSRMMRNGSGRTDYSSLLDQRFNWEKIAEQTMEIYRNILPVNSSVLQGPGSLLQGLVRIRAFQDGEGSQARRKGEGVSR